MPRAIGPIYTFEWLSATPTPREIAPERTRFSGWLAPEALMLKSLFPACDFLSFLSSKLTQSQNMIHAQGLKLSCNINRKNFMGVAGLVSITMV